MLECTHTLNNQHRKMMSDSGMSATHTNIELNIAYEGRTLSVSMNRTNQTEQTNQCSGMSPRQTLRHS